MNIAVLGGDLRAVELCNALAHTEHTVYAFGFDKGCRFNIRVKVCSDVETDLENCALVIFPLPVSNDKINLFAPFAHNTYPLLQIFERIKKAKAVFGGKVSFSVMETAREHGIEIIDYLEKEQFAILNAVPTAEGAIQLAMEQLPFTLHGSRCLLLGYGRISKVLAGMLQGLGARTAVAARKTDQLTWAALQGNETFALTALEQKLSEFDVIFNTIPSTVLNRKLLKTMQPDCLLIELASLPGGIDKTAADQLGCKWINAQSLPGKVAPVSSGKIIMDTILTEYEQLHL